MLKHSIVKILSNVSHYKFCTFDFLVKMQLNANLLVSKQLSRYPRVVFSLLSELCFTSTRCVGPHVDGSVGVSFVCVFGKLLFEK